MLQGGRRTGFGRRHFWAANCDPISYLALLHMNGSNGSTTFTDESGTTWTAVSGATISTAQSQLGSAVGSFPGAGARIDSDTALPNLLVDDFTVEAFIRPASFAGSANIIMSASNGANAWDFRLGSTGTSLLLCFPGLACNSAAFAFSVDTWYHVACARHGTVFRFYVDGVQLTTVGSANRIETVDRAISIGSQPGGSFPFDGFIDEARITTGHARYTSASFPVPSVEFTNAICPAPTFIAPPTFKAQNGSWRFFRMTVTRWGTAGSFGTGTGGVRSAEFELVESAVSYPTVNMTTNTAPSPLVASVSDASLGAAFNGFDGNISNSGRWISTGSSSPHWIQIDLGVGNEITPDSYKWAPDDGASGGYFPVDWRLEGSNTGAFAGEQTVLDGQTQITTGWTNFTLRTFSINYV